MSNRGIPPISDYSHWNEDAEYMWYMENKYDMENPPEPDYDDDPYTPDEDEDYGKED